MTDHNEPNNEREKRPPSTRAEVLMAAFSGIVMLIGCISAGISYWQWSLGREQLDFATNSAAAAAQETAAALDISKRVALAAELQSNAAAEATEISRESLELSRESVKASIAALNVSLTPHIKITMNEIEGYEQGGSLQGFVKVENTSSVTVFDAVVTTGRILARRDTIQSIWKNLGRPRTIIIPPKDDHGFRIHHRRLSMAERDAFHRQEMVLVVGAKVVFRDAAKVRHVRYVCTLFFDSGGILFPDECPTPRQS